MFYKWPGVLIHFWKNVKYQVKEVHNLEGKIIKIEKGA